MEGTRDRIFVDREEAGRLLGEALRGRAGADPIVLALPRERVELERRVALYRGGRPPPDVQGRTVVLVDDGVATGGTARAALRAIRRQGPARLLFAVPVGAGDTIASLRADADEVVCLQTPRWFHAIGEWYQDFSQVDDGRVIGCLAQARSPGADAGGLDVSFRVDGIDLPGRVEVPVGAHGLVVFVHGSGSSRRSPRNRGGRPDLARGALPGVRAPVLLIVGGRDPAVIELNREALRSLSAPASLAIVSGATHLFEEAHALDEVVRLAVRFLERTLLLEPALEPA